MRRGLLSIAVLVVASCRVEAGCIDPASLAHSTVSIARYFDDKEREVEPGLLGVRGTGWFLSPTSMATIEHVAVAMNLSDQSWKEVEVRTGDHSQSIPIRIRRIVGSQAEKIAVLELQTAFPEAQGFALRMEPLVPEETVVSLAYPGDQLRIAAGRFVKYGDDARLAGTALLEMYDGDDRLVLDHGASGAPIFDCAGRVVAVASNLLTTSIQLDHTRFASPRLGELPTSFPCRPQY